MVYRLGTAWSLSVAQLEEKLQSAAFVECGLTQEKSVRWVPPRGQVHGPLVESVGRQLIFKLMLESKAVEEQIGGTGHNLV